MRRHCAGLVALGACSVATAVSSPSPAAGAIAEGLRAASSASRRRSDSTQKKNNNGRAASGKARSTSNSTTSKGSSSDNSRRSQLAAREDSNSPKGSEERAVPVASLLAREHSVDRRFTSSSSHHGGVPSGNRPPRDEGRRDNNGGRSDRGRHNHASGAGSSRRSSISGSGGARGASATAATEAPPSAQWEDATFEEEADAAGGEASGSPPQAAAHQRPSEEEREAAPSDAAAKTHASSDSPPSSSPLSSSTSAVSVAATNSRFRRKGGADQAAAAEGAAGRVPMTFGLRPPSPSSSSPMGGGGGEGGRSSRFGSASASSHIVVSEHKAAHRLGGASSPASAGPPSEHVSASRHFVRVAGDTAGDDGQQRAEQNEGRRSSADVSSPEAHHATPVEQRPSPSNPSGTLAAVTNVKLSFSTHASTRAGGEGDAPPPSSSLPAVVTFCQTMRSQYKAIRRQEVADHCLHQLAGYFACVMAPQLSLAGLAEASQRAVSAANGKSGVGAGVGHSASMDGDDGALASGTASSAADGDGSHTAASHAAGASAASHYDEARAHLAARNLAASAIAFDSAWRVGDVGRQVPLASLSGSPSPSPSSSSTSSAGGAKGSSSALVVVRPDYLATWLPMASLTRGMQAQSTAATAHRTGKGTSAAAAGVDSFMLAATAAAEESSGAHSSLHHGGSSSHHQSSSGVDLLDDAFINGSDLGRLGADAIMASLKPLGVSGAARLLNHVAFFYNSWVELESIGAAKKLHGITNQSSLPLNAAGTHAVVGCSATSAISSVVANGADKATVAMESLASTRTAAAGGRYPIVDGAVADPADWGEFSLTVAPIGGGMDGAPPASVIHCPYLVAAGLKQMYRSSLLRRPASSSPSSLQPSEGVPPITAVDSAAARVRHHSAAIALLWINLLTKYIALNSESLDMLGTSLTLLALSGGPLRVPNMSRVYLPRLTVPIALSNNRASQEWKRTGKMTNVIRSNAAASGGGRFGASGSISATGSSLDDNTAGGGDDLPSVVTTNATKMELIAVVSACTKLIDAYPSLARDALSYGVSSQRGRSQRFASSSSPAALTSYNYSVPYYERLPNAMAHLFNVWSPLYHIATWSKHSLVHLISQLSPHETVPILQLVTRFGVAGNILNREFFGARMAEMIASKGSRVAPPQASSHVRTQLTSILGELLVARWCDALTANDAAQRSIGSPDGGHASNNNSSSDGGVTTRAGASEDEEFALADAAPPPRDSEEDAEMASRGDRAARGNVTSQRMVAATFTPYLWVSLLEQSRIVFKEASVRNRIAAMGGGDVNSSSTATTVGQGAVATPLLISQSLNAAQIVASGRSEEEGVLLGDVQRKNSPSTPSTVTSATITAPSPFLLLKDAFAAEALVTMVSRRISCIAVMGGYLMCPDTRQRIGVEVFSGHTSTLQQWTLDVLDDMEALTRLLSDNIHHHRRQHKEAGVVGDDSASSAGLSASVEQQLRAQLGLVAKHRDTLMRLSAQRPDDVFDWSIPPSARSSLTPSFITSSNLYPLLIVGTSKGPLLRSRLEAAAMRAAIGVVLLPSAAAEKESATAAGADSSASPSAPATEGGESAASPQSASGTTAAEAASSEALDGSGSTPAEAEAAAVAVSSSPSTTAPTPAGAVKPLAYVSRHVVRSLFKVPLGHVELAQQGGGGGAPSAAADAKKGRAGPSASLSASASPPPNSKEFHGLVGKTIIALGRRLVRSTLQWAEEADAKREGADVPTAALPTTIDANAPPIASVTALPITAADLRFGLAALHLLSLHHPNGFSHQKSWSAAKDKEKEPTATAPSTGAAEGGVTSPSAPPAAAAPAAPDTGGSNTSSTSANSASALDVARAALERALVHFATTTANTVSNGTISADASAVAAAEGVGTGAGSDVGTAADPSRDSIIGLETVLSAYALRIITADVASSLVQARFQSIMKEEEEANVGERTANVDGDAESGDASSSVAFHAAIRRLLLSDVLPLDATGQAEGRSVAAAEGLAEEEGAASDSPSDESPPRVLLNLNALLDSIGRVAFDLRREEGPQLASGERMAATKAEAAADIAEEVAAATATDTTPQPDEGVEAAALTPPSPPSPSFTSYRILSALAVEITTIKARYASLDAAVKKHRDGERSGDADTAATANHQDIDAASAPPPQRYSSKMADRIAFAALRDEPHGIGLHVGHKPDRQLFGSGAYVLSHLYATYASNGWHHAREAYVGQMGGVASSPSEDVPQCADDSAEPTANAEEGRANNANENDDAADDGDDANSAFSNTIAAATRRVAARLSASPSEVARQAMLLSPLDPLMARAMTADTVGTSAASAIHDSSMLFDDEAMVSAMKAPLPGQEEDSSLSAAVEEAVVDALVAADRHVVASALAHRAALCAKALQAGYDRLLLWVASTGAVLDVRWRLPTAGEGGSGSKQQQQLRFVAQKPAGGGGGGDSNGAPPKAQSPSTNPLTADFHNLDLLLRLTIDVFLNRASCNVGVFKRVTHSLSMLQAQGASVDMGMSLVVAANRLYADRKVQVQGGPYEFAVSCTLHPSTHFGIVMVLANFKNESLTTAMQMHIFRAITIAGMGELVTSQQRSYVVELAKNAMTSTSLDLQCTALRAMAASNCAPSSIFYQLASVVLAHRDALSMAQLGDLLACAPHMESCDDVLCPALRSVVLGRMRRAEAVGDGSSSTSSSASGHSMRWVEVKTLLPFLSVAYIGDTELWQAVVDSYCADLRAHSSNDRSAAADADGDDVDGDDVDGDDEEDSASPSSTDASAAVVVRLSTIPIALKAALCEAACSQLVEM